MKNTCNPVLNFVKTLPQNSESLSLRAPPNPPPLKHKLIQKIEFSSEMFILTWLTAMKLRPFIVCGFFKQVIGCN